MSAKGEGEQKQPQTVSEKIIKYQFSSVWLSEQTLVGRTRGTPMPRKKRPEQSRHVKNSQTHHRAEQFRGKKGEKQDTPDRP